MARFDWWQGTLQVSDYEVDGILAGLSERFEWSDIVPDRPRNGYQRGAKIVRGEHTFATVWWQGNPGVHVKGTGEDAPIVGPHLQALGALPSRVDVCEDWTVPGVTELLFRTAQEFALENNITMNHQGDWSRNHSRTLYLGSRSSTAQLVIYEKGHQVGGDPNWIRMEGRLYPKRNREHVGRLQPGECFFVSPWIGRYLHTKLDWAHLPSISTGTTRQPTDYERARLSLLRQYGKILSAWKEDAGTWNDVGQQIESQLATLRSQPQKPDQQKVSRGEAQEYVS